ncbi:MAG: methylenetetrahydrofolate reductase [Gemmatimonadetes bacterium]|jgi:methylenetetrahydrofolate reductase (NADPH)|nr:methylenetetrahydrofolate reductase [Gemmatimonadota bacterium]
MTAKAGSNLERVLAEGHFALTVEVGPPRGPDPEEVIKKARLIKGVADAYNVTDNQTAVVRMSSIAASKILVDQGLEPVMQMVCRDRNRIAIQSDLLGAHALGMRNCLCLSGDHQSAGAGGKLQGHPGAKNVFDIDSIQLLSVVKGLRDDAIQEGGDSIDPAAPFFIGAAWTPLGPPEKFRTVRLAKKVDAGADFVQTQAVYDIPRFAEAVKRAEDAGLTERTAILAGIIVPRSAGMLKYMNANVPGIDVPEEMIERMKSASSPKKEGVKVTLELIDAVRNISGIKGVHLQAIEAEGMLPDIIEVAGLLPRP